QRSQPQGGMPDAQTAPAQSNPAQTPATQTPPATPVPPSQPAGTKRPPQAKSQDELTAYNAIRNLPVGDAAEQAAKDFETKFPQSELRALIYQGLMGSYQASNNADRAIDMGRKSIAIEPDNTFVLIMLATVLAERTRETDIDRDQRYEEAIRYAKHGLETMNTGVVVPAATPLDKIEKLKQLLTSMAQAALGFVELNRHNDAAAEQHLREAAQLNTVQPDPMAY